MERFVPNTEQGETPDKRQWHTNRKSYSSSDEWMFEQKIVRNVLNSFNEQALNDIMNELAGKAGIDIRTIDLPSFEQIEIGVDQFSNSAGESRLSGIFVNEAQLPNDGTKVSRYRVLWIIIHEYLHQLSTVNVEEYNELTLETYKSTFVEKTGVASYSTHLEFDLINTGKDKKEQSEKNKFINEGITEWLTGKVFDEYIKRTGETKLRSVEKDERIEDIRGIYWVERLNVELYIIFLSEYLEQPVSIIEGSVIRTYLRNGEIVPEEIIDTLNVATKKRDLVLSLFKEKINEKDFAVLLVDLVRSLPAEKRDVFISIVSIKFGQVVDAIEINNQKFDSQFEV